MNHFRLLAAVTLALACGCGGSQTSDPAAGAATASAAPTTEPAAPGDSDTASPTATAAPTGSPQSGELIGVPIADKKTGGGSAAADASGGAQSVEIVYVESKAPKTGTKKLLFDVTLRNQRTEPRWFVLPAVVHPQDKMLKSGVDGVELFMLKGDSKVTMGRFTGKGGFHAVLLPGGSELKVQKLPIECHFGTLKECAVPIEVVIAGKLSIGGEPAEKWFGDKALSEGKGQVTYETAVKSGGKKAGGVKEVALEDPKRVKMTLIIGGT